ncbi:MAG TPA: hypothetical protein VF035_00960 [Longimicrobiales bacterium]
MFDSEPAEIEVTPALPAEPVAIPEPPSYSELMPWEEYTLLEAAQAAAMQAAADETASREEPPVDDAEPAVVEPDRTGDGRALEAWEGSLEGEGGEAVPAWGDEKAAEEVAFTPAPRLDDEGVMIPDEIAESAGEDASFPLDAFIIPPHAKRLPKGLEHAEAVQGEIAEELAYRLDAMASRLRSEGFPGLIVLDADHRPVDTLLAGVLAGYLAHEAEQVDADGPQ